MIVLQQIDNFLFRWRAVKQLTMLLNNPLHGGVVLYKDPAAPGTVKFWPLGVASANTLARKLEEAEHTSSREAS